MKTRKFSFLFTALVFGATMVISPASAKDDSLHLKNSFSGFIKAQLSPANLNTAANVNANVAVKASDDRNLPPGMERAPGIEKRIENGKGLPPGLERHFKEDDDEDDDDADEESEDNVQSLIERFAITNVTAHRAIVNVSTNEATRVQVFIGSANPLVSTSSSVYTDNRLANNHRLALTNLNADATYYVMVKASDRSGNLTISATATFKTLADPADVETPNIFGPFEISVSQNSAVIIWFTTERSDSRVWRTTSSTIDTALTANVSDDGDVFLHRAVLTGLQADTKYNYVVGSTDMSGNAAVSAMSSFTTKL